MIRYLLDVNVLIALIDPAYVQHDEVHEWFGKVGHKAFATCPITENGPYSISLVQSDLVDPALLSSHNRVTDSYLLALARANKGKLATMDHKLATEVVAAGKTALALL